MHSTPASKPNCKFFTRLLILVLLVVAGCQSAPWDATSSPANTKLSGQIAKALSVDADVIPADWISQGLEDNPDLTEDASIRTLYSIARNLVERRFDVRLDNITLEIVDDPRIEKIVRRETTHLTRAVFSDTNFADFFVNRVMQDQTGSYAGLFVHPENTILLNRDLLDVFQQRLKSQSKRVKAESILSLLIHELVHAADNERYQIHAKRELNFRASVAQSAVFEGHAQFATREICKQEGCLRGLAQLDAFMFEAPEPTDPLARSLQAVSRNVLEYSYVEGERFLRRLSERQNGAQHLSNVLRHPPQDPVQILTPETYPDTARVDRNRSIFKLIQSIDHRWNDPKFALVETSPIKGINIRNDPERRAATKEGFTQLITSMVGLQIFDQSADTLLPIEITVMQTDTIATAKLFAHSFHKKAANNNSGDSQTNTLHLNLGEVQGIAPTAMKIYLTQTRIDKDVDDATNGDIYVSVVASSDNWIIQMGGFANGFSGEGANQIEVSNEVTSGASISSFERMLEFSELTMFELIQSKI